MTTNRTQPDNVGADPRPSLLPFNPADLMAMRVRPAEFARMVGVSKQSVSRWAREGKIAIGPDGKLDPAKASRDVIRHTDPARLRARVFKQAVATHSELRKRIATMEANARAADAIAERRIAAARNRERDTAAEALGYFMDAIAARFTEAQAAHTARRLAEWLDELAAVEVYGLDLAEYRAELAAVADAAGACPVVPAKSTE